MLQIDTATCVWLITCTVSLLKETTTICVYFYANVICTISLLKETRIMLCSSVTNTLTSTWGSFILLLLLFFFFLDNHSNNSWLVEPSRTHSQSKSWPMNSEYTVIHLVLCVGLIERGVPF